MTCQQDKCDKDAKYIVMWPNQVTKQCEEHAAKVVKLGEFMGIQVPLILILDIVDDQDDLSNSK